MNILILSGSPRKGGNTELLAEAFAKGAAAHHHVEIASVRDYQVNPCLGCNACFKTNGICAQKDDVAIIYEKMSQADMLVRGVKDKGDIKNTDALNEAYTLGFYVR